MQLMSLESIAIPCLPPSLPRVWATHKAVMPSGRHPTIPGPPSTIETAMDHGRVAKTSYHLGCPASALPLIIPGPTCSTFPGQTDHEAGLHCCAQHCRWVRDSGHRHSHTRRLRAVLSLGGQALHRGCTLVIAPNVHRRVPHCIPSTLTGRRSLLKDSRPEADRGKFPVVAPFCDMDDDVVAHRTRDSHLRTCRGPGPPWTQTWHRPSGSSALLKSATSLRRPEPAFPPS